MPKLDLSSWCMELGISSCPYLSGIRSWQQSTKPMDQYSAIVGFVERPSKYMSLADSLTNHGCKRQMRKQFVGVSNRV